MEIARLWHQPPDWLATLPIDQQEHLWSWFILHRQEQRTGSIELPKPTKTTTFNRTTKPMWASKGSREP